MTAARFIIGSFAFTICSGCGTQSLTRGEIIKIGTSDTTMLKNNHRNIIGMALQRPKAANCLASLDAATA